MKKTLLDFMEETSKEVLEIIGRRKELTKEAVDYLKTLKFKDITIVSCGSSYNIARNCIYFMRKRLKVPVHLESAFQFYQYDLPMISKDTLFVCMSQSGRSINVNTAARRLVKDGYQIVGFTDNPVSPMGEILGGRLFTYHRTGDDDYVIKSFVLHSVFLMLVTCEYALEIKSISQSEYDKDIQMIIKAVKSADVLRKSAIDFYSTHRMLMRSMDRVIILGCGPSMGTAMEASLKLQETYACQATAFEVEEYFHGPSLCCNKDTTVFIIDDKNSPIHRRAKEAYLGLRCMTDRVIVLTNDENFDGINMIVHSTEGIPEDIAVIYNIIPFQYFCYILMDETQVSAIGREGKKCDTYYVIKE